MWKKWFLAAVVLLLTGIAWSPVAFADKGEDEEDVAFEQLPAAVRKAVKKAYPDAKIIECEKETERGRTVYEVELRVGDREVEIELDASGKVLEEEEEIAPNQLPKPVAKALKRLLPRGKVVEAERETEAGKTTYEVEVRCGKVILELKLDKSGKVLRIEVEEEDDD